MDTALYKCLLLLLSSSSSSSSLLLLLLLTFLFYRDHWNLFDLAIIFIYFFVIFPLRTVTWAVSESVPNNRALEIAGYFYGFNTMLLTFRAFGSILETLNGVGTVQIALFEIIRDAVVVALHFVAITLAFSSSITKIFVVEASRVKDDPEKYT